MKTMYLSFNTLFIGSVLNVFNLVNGLLKYLVLCIVFASCSAPRVKQTTNGVQKIYNDFAKNCNAKTAEDKNSIFILGKANSLIESNAQSFSMINAMNSLALMISNETVTKLGQQLRDTNSNNILKRSRITQESVSKISVDATDINLVSATITKESFLISDGSYDGLVCISLPRKEFAKIVDETKEKVIKNLANKNKAKGGKN